MKLINKKTNNKLLWSGLTMFLTLMVFIIFFGSKILTNISTTVFSTTSDDLIKDVYTSFYHVKYDSTYTHSAAMNYPYGEYYTYTGIQSLVTTPLQVLQKSGAGDLSQYVLPLINLHVILSIFLCSLFLFLLFKELKIPNVIATLGAIAITFLSPQLQRIGGHLTLSYSFIIPAILFLLARNYNSPKLIYSIFLGLLLIWSGFAHPYYLLFFAFLSTFYAGYIFFYDKERFGGRIKIILMYGIQFIVPIICFFVLSSIGDSASDRTLVPNGFYSYQGRIEGIVFPYESAYFREISQVLPYIKWEVRSYIGIVSLAVFVGLTISFIIKICKRQFSSIFTVTDNTLLNIFFWTALLVLFFSFGTGINLFPHKIQNYLGPLAQIRTLGRYTWLFFYVINIIAIYVIYHFLWQSSIKTWKKYALIILVFALFAYEDYAYAKDFKYWYTCENPKQTDYENKLPENNWVNNIHSSDFQAILAFPFFHVGSEQYFLSPKDKIFEIATYVSMKTGLPMFNNSSSRSSIKKTYKNAALSWEPWCVFPILSDIKSSKPILLIKPTNTESLNENEVRIIEYADYMFSANEIDFYSLKIESLLQLCNDYQKNRQKTYNSNKLFPKTTNLYSNDSLSNYYFQSWDNNTSSQAIYGKGCLSGIINEKNILFNSKTPLVHPDTCEISFWISNFTDDLYGRSRCKIIIKDLNQKEAVLDDAELTERVSGINKDWALIRTIVVLPYDAHYLTITVSNNDMLSKIVHFDNLLIRPSKCNVTFSENEYYFLNNSIVKF